MTDKEMLEYAAKAAGVDSDRLKNRYDHWDKDHAPVLVGRAWNPLTGDGDALRLAVKLRLPFRDGLNGTVETGNERSGRPIWELWGDDPLAATRRAIVRAAAEIGRSMK
jgi:hypothetical protein